MQALQVSNPALEGYRVLQQLWLIFFNPRYNNFIGPEPKCSGTYGDENRFNVWSAAVAGQAVMDGARIYPQEMGPLVDPTVKALYQYKNHGLKGYSVSNNRDGDIYYDDDAQVQFAFINAYEVTQNKEYLDASRELTLYLLGGWNNDPSAKTKGGILWHRDKPYLSAISNTETALACLRTAKFIPNEKDFFVGSAAKIMDWVLENLLDKEDNLIVDGVGKDQDISQRNGMKWTYNTGTALNAAALLYEHTGDEKWAKVAHDLAAAAVDRNRSIFCRDYGEMERRYYRDPSYFIQLLFEGFADYLLVFGDKAPPQIAEAIKLETARHLLFFRKYLFDPTDGLYFQMFEAYKISPDHHKLYCEEFGDSKGFEANNEERAASGDGPLEQKPLVKTLIGTASAARIWFQAARILPQGA
ncbi:hypothetical protein WICPIJ_001301 [Wickerhamomyces pijperi]|uniref:Glycoside hydrolase family 76 protein n=1 Tax=Wickerhamomyces pijperi TaxID=599730 RepID=A0A9P8QDT3_WICPI|nr:hypothetical protein WICPIJ_001301 [Wickerhamomyces pijperi]